jgi:hypothetical protein
MAEFTTELYRLLGIKAAKTTACHLQADGQTERVNQELEQYLRLFTSERQDDWIDLLAMAEFQYNNHIHSSTQQTPFSSIAANTRGWVSNRNNRLEWKR